MYAKKIGQAINLSGIFLEIFFETFDFMLNNSYYCTHKSIVTKKMNTKKLLLIAFSTVVCAVASMNFYVNHSIKASLASLAETEALATGEGFEIINAATSGEMYCQIVFFHTNGDEYGQAPNFDGVPPGAQVVATCDGHRYDCIPQEGSICFSQDCECL